jgi:hypothetical protein
MANAHRMEPDDFYYVLCALLCNGGMHRPGVVVEMGPVFHGIQHLAGFFLAVIIYQTGAALGY